MQGAIPQIIKEGSKRESDREKLERLRAEKLTKAEREELDKLEREENARLRMVRAEKQTPWAVILLVIGLIILFALVTPEIEYLIEEFSSFFVD